MLIVWYENDAIEEQVKKCKICNKVWELPIWSSILDFDTWSFVSKRTSRIRLNVLPWRIGIFCYISLLLSQNIILRNFGYFPYSAISLICFLFVLLESLRIWCTTQTHIYDARVVIFSYYSITKRWDSQDGL